MLKLGFLASHTGSNMQAIINACQAGTLAAEPRVVISNNSQSGALARARQANIAAYHLSERTHGEALGGGDSGGDAAARGRSNLPSRIHEEAGVGRVLASYEGRILNIHPALLPKFGGQGMYGMRVHEAVLAAGERESGATVHLVDEEYDHGRVLAQEKVPVKAEDTPETLQKRVLAVEHRLYAATLAQIAAGEIPIPLPRPRA